MPKGDWKIVLTITKTYNKKYKVRLIKVRLIK